MITQVFFLVDAIVLSDNPMFSSNQPSICTSIRGLIYLDVKVESMNSDVHSGQLGGGVPNVIHYVSQLLSAMKDPVTNRVLIPGFYNDVGQYTGVTLSDDTVTKYLNELDQSLRIGRHANTDFLTIFGINPRWIAMAFQLVLLMKVLKLLFLMWLSLKYHVDWLVIRNRNI